jgi:glutamyl-Q tRNA(Asp) synthetase
MSQPVFRFAPSPNGPLHLGHAYSAILNHDLVRRVGGRFLLRIEDIDRERSRMQFERAIHEDLAWLGLGWEDPVRRQSDHFDDYRAALDRLVEAELVYPAFLSRGDVRAFIADEEARGIDWPRDPDGAPLYPTIERHLPSRERRARIEAGAPFAWRLDVDAAMNNVSGRLDWHEEGFGLQGETGLISADPRIWGDFIVARKDLPTSYQLSVVVDDAIQGVTHVVRGRDLFHATSGQRLLQELLGLTPPTYLHHDLILGEDGRKLSKSRGDTALGALRMAGAQPQDIRRMVGL